MTEGQSANRLTCNFGSSTLVFEPPTLAYLVVREPLREGDIVALLDFFGELREKHGRLRLLADVSNLSAMSRESREAPSRRPDADSIMAMAIVGASFRLRITLTMLLKAMRILIRRRYSYPFEFFNSYEEAHAWLMRQTDEQPQ